MNEELDSQLSAMFDDELPEEQCLLLARRLSRDDALKARWRRYAVMGAAIRAERQGGGALSVRLDTNIAARVSAAISGEPALAADAVAQGGVRKVAGMRWWQPVAGGAIAAGVAAMSVLWIRAQAPLGDETLLAQNGVAPSALTQTVAQTDNSAPVSYVVPAAVERTPMVPSAELANYVLAHSEFSAPVNRRNMLSALVASEPAGDEDAGTSGTLNQSDDANVVEVPRPNVEKAK
jgi:sigma-E factor negative regulatory protein RseA